MSYSLEPELQARFVVVVVELPCGCWELNPGPLEKQSVLLPTEASLQLEIYSCFRMVVGWCV